jgi:hypothetical protein
MAQASIARDRRARPPQPVRANRSPNAFGCPAELDELDEPPDEHMTRAMGANQAKARKPSEDRIDAS